MAAKGLPILSDEGWLVVLMAQVVFEFALLCISIYLTRRHIAGAKKLTDSSLYHGMHSLFCVSACSKELWSSVIDPFNPKSCSSMQMNLVALIPQILFYTLFIGIFFNHWERALVQAYLHVRLRLPRVVGYVLSSAIVFSMCIAQYQVSEGHNNDNDARCQKRVSFLFTVGVVPLGIICAVELSWLTWNLWALSYVESEQRSRANTLTPEVFRPRAFTSHLASRMMSVEDGISFPVEMTGGGSQDIQASNDAGEKTSCFTVDVISRQMPLAMAAMTASSYLGLAYLIERLFSPTDTSTVQFVMYKLLVTIPLSGFTLVYMWFSRHLALDDEFSATGAGSIIEFTAGDSFSFNRDEFQAPFVSTGEGSDSSIAGALDKNILFMDDDSAAVKGPQNPINKVDHDEEDDEDLEDDSIGLHDTSTLLQFTDPLTSSLRVEFSGLLERQQGGLVGLAHQRSDGNLGNLLGAAAREDGSVFPNVSLTIDEELRPGPVTLPLARLFAKQIALPALHLATSTARSDVSTLLKMSHPPSGGTLAIKNMEQIRLYKDLVTGGSRIMAKYEGAIRIFQALVDSGDEHGRAPQLDSRGFKTSKAKKVAALAPVSTNLHLHRTTLRGVAEKSGGGSGEGAEGNTPARELCATSVTVGAPAAHSVGFKSGGLREVEEKLRSWTNLSSPDDAMEHLQLRFVQTAREHIVVSQALGLVVGAALSALADCVAERQENLLTQWSAQNAGLLVHSVCLLTTAGKEAAMIDDFAGACERLNVRLRLDREESSLLKRRRDSALYSPGLWGVGSKGPSFNGKTWKMPVTVSVVGLQKFVPHVDDKASPPTSKGNRKSLSSANLSIDGGCGNLVVVLQIEPPEAHSWAVKILDGAANLLSPPHAPFKDAAPVDIRIVPVLFNLGVNEMQTIANAKKTTGIQTDINRHGVQELRAYHLRCVEFSRRQQELENLRGVEADLEKQEEDSNRNTLLLYEVSPEVTPLLALLEDLVEDEAKHRRKNVDLLLTSCFAARLLNGARTTSCKSAKDRTSVFHTLEMARLASRAGLLGRSSASPKGEAADTGAAAAHRNKALDEHKSDRVLHTANELRGPCGVRLRNCELNTGKLKYAFNVLQQKALPAELRPPPSTAGSGKS